jgi:CBS domain-containing protein
MPVSGITLFIFGGVSELEEEPPTPGAEFFMAIVGPVSSVFIGAVFLLAWGILAIGMDVGGAWVALLRYLWTINFLLAAFNSLPAFPLDGGRVLRGVLWWFTRNLQKSTRIASMVGSTFAMILMVGGVLLAFQGVLITGIWFIFIGLFLRRAAMSAMQDVVLRLQLTGERVGRFMTENPVTVHPDLNLQEFVDSYVLHYHFTHFPVVDEDGRLVGIVRARDPKQVDSDRWPRLHVSDVMERPAPGTTIAPDADAVEALSRLRGEERKRLIVVQNNHPVGIVSLRDLMDFLALKIDLNPRNMPE